MSSNNQKIDIEKLLKSNRTILTNETSVYKEYAILNENALTSDGYFDLIQIPNLRVYAGNLLKSIRLKSS